MRQLPPCKPQGQSLMVGRAGLCLKTDHAAVVSHVCARAMPPSEHRSHTQSWHGCKHVVDGARRELSQLQAVWALRGLFQAQGTVWGPAVYILGFSSSLCGPGSEIGACQRRALFACCQCPDAGPTPWSQPAPDIPYHTQLAGSIARDGT